MRILLITIYLFIIPITFLSAEMAPRVAAEKLASDRPVDPVLELRTGLGLTWMVGDLRLLRGTGAFNEFELQDVNIGKKVDLDWQPMDRLHVNFSFFKNNLAGESDLAGSLQNPQLLFSSNTLDVKADIFTFENTIGYEVIKNDTYRLMPYIGGKMAVVDIRVESNYRQFENIDDVYGTVLIGIDQRVYMSHDFYGGLIVAGFGMENWGYVRGEAYLGYDFSDKYGIRAGYEVDYFNYRNPNSSTQFDPLLGNVYIQFVRRF
jgi:hypothetical protein